MPFAKLFRGSALRDHANELYVAAVAQARQPTFYDRFGVPDTLDGRFDMIVLHVFLLLRRLRREGAVGSELGQLVFDVMFDDMDRSLREMGVGDLGVGRRVKAMAKAYYGRAAAYDAALEADDRALEEALRRNVYGAVRTGAVQATALAGYVRAAIARLDRQDGPELLAGRIDFGGAPDGVAGEPTRSAE